MIKLTDVANKLQNILNGIDAEAGNSPLSDEFYFKVETEGFHLDSIAMVERYERKNFIPVFIGVIGGEYNPIPTIIDEEITLPITIYVPIRFKTHMYDLNNFLVKTFVGAQLTYSENLKAISNISVATFSEMEQSSLKQFREWVSDVYDTPIELDDNYFLMEFNLFLNCVKVKLSNGTAPIEFGNKILDIELTYKENADDTPKTLKVYTMGIVTNYQATSSVQQILTENQTEGLAQTSVMTVAFTAYFNYSPDYQLLLRRVIQGNVQGMEFNVKLLHANFQPPNGPVDLGEMYCTSAMMNAAYGEPLTVAFVFARRIV